MTRVELIPEILCVHQDSPMAENLQAINVPKYAKNNIFISNAPKSSHEDNS
jgi:hypothetical protein